MFQMAPQNNNHNWEITIQTGGLARVDLVTNENPVFFGIKLDCYLFADMHRYIWVHKSEGEQFVNLMMTSMAMDAIYDTGNIVFVRDTWDGEYSLVLYDKRTQHQFWLQDRKTIMAVKIYVDSGYDSDEVLLWQKNHNAQGYIMKEYPFVMQPGCQPTFQVACPVCKEQVNKDDVRSVYIDGACLNCEHNSPPVEEF